MSNIFIALPCPAANGAGAAVDMTAFGFIRTITSTGPYVGTVNVEISNESAPTMWAPLATFDAALGPNGQTVNVACKWMRARVSGYISGTPVVNVGGTSDGTLVASLPATAGSGTGAAVDISSLGLAKTVTVGGPFGGNVQLELSEDGGTTWTQVGFAGFLTPGESTTVIAANRARVVRAGVPLIAPGLPIVDIGGCVIGGGGGGGGAAVTKLRYTATGGESAFVVPFGAPLSAAPYNVVATGSGMAFVVGIDCPVSGRTASQFSVVTTGALTAGDTIDFEVAQ